MFPLLVRTVPHVEEKILSHLEPMDLLSSKLVCKQWNVTIQKYKDNLTIKMFPRFHKSMSHVEQKILSYLEPSDLIACKLVCMSWFVVIQKRQAPLLNAVTKGYTNVADFLLRSKYINVNERNAIGDTVNHTTGVTPLIIAAQKGNESIVKILLERRDTDINAYNKYGYTALMLATVYSQARIVELLLQRADTDVNASMCDTVYHTTGLTALTLAAHGDTKIVKLLLERRDIDVNAADRNGNTALLTAVTHGDGNYEIVRLFLERSETDVNAVGMYIGRTALMWVAMRGLTRLVELLLERKDIDVSMTDTAGKTALDYATANGHEAIVRLLEEKK